MSLSDDAAVAERWGEDERKTEGSRMLASALIPWSRFRRAWRIESPGPILEIRWKNWAIARGAQRARDLHESEGMNSIAGCTLGVRKEPAQKSSARRFENVWFNKHNLRQDR